MARLTVRHAAAQYDAGHPAAPAFAALAKKVATDLGFEVVDAALQLHGGYGYLQSFPLERFLRDVRVHVRLRRAARVARAAVRRRRRAVRSRRFNVVTAGSHDFQFNVTGSPHRRVPYAAHLGGHQRDHERARQPRVAVVMGPDVAPAGTSITLRLTRCPSEREASGLHLGFGVPPAYRPWLAPSYL